MEWLSQNWVWLALAAGVVLMMRHGGHGGHGGCCGGGQGEGRKRSEGESTQNRA